MPSLRVLALAASVSSENGWGTYAKSVTELLRADGMDVTLLTSDANSPLRLPGVLANRIAWMMGGIRLARWLYAHRDQFDVIHVMVEPYARLFRSFHGLPFVITIHGSFVDPAMHGSGRVRFIEALQHAARFITVSAFTHARLPVNLQSRATVITNGVDPAMTEEPFVAPRAHGSPQVLSVGIFKPRKGFEELIAGFAVFARTNPNAELVMIGPDPSGYRPVLEQAVAQAGVAGRVRILGRVPREILLGWYRACDVFALTPNDRGGFEGFGLVYLEAALFGKPSIGSRNSGASEAIQEGVSGVLCHPEHPAEVADALTQALSLNTESIRAYAHAQTWLQRTNAYRAVLASVTASSSERRTRG